eukprot:12458550-Alexandrium_andersonii.AAC.1
MDFRRAWHLQPHLRVELERSWLVYAKAGCPYCRWEGDIVTAASRWGWESDQNYSGPVGFLLRSLGGHLMD